MTIETTTYPADYDWSDRCSDPNCHICNPLLPAVIYDVYFQVNANTSLQIWERSGTRFQYNRRVYAYQA